TTAALDPIGPGRTVATTSARTPAATGGGTSGLLRGPLGAGAGDVALVDPDLDADPAERGPGLEEAVVDVGAERVQRHLALAVELRPAHLGAAQTAGALDPDTLRAGPHRGLLRLAHRPAERHPGGQLLGHALGHQLRVGLGVLHLEDVQLHLLAGQLLQLAANALRLGAVTADHDARPRGVDVDADPVPGALDLHRGDTGPLQALQQRLADLDVLAHVVGVLLVGVPAALVVGRDAQPEAVRV